MNRLLLSLALLCFVATSAVAQDSNAVVAAIERASQTGASHWSVDLKDVQSQRAAVLRWRSGSSDTYVSVALLILSDADQAHQHFDESVSENIRFFHADKSRYTKTKLTGLADENYLFTFRQGNPFVTLRKGKYFVSVDSSSLQAVKTFAWLVANQLPAT